MPSDEEYERQRTTPIPGDPEYLPLSDLLIAIKTLFPSDTIDVLDYGAGLSPYRTLLKGNYARADIVQNAWQNSDRALNYLIDEHGRLPDNIPSFDLVISTQVLEHVSNPLLYLSECRRALKQNGFLIVTTHGSFEDHPCPKDYWRWTAEGLAELVAREGFKVQKVLKLTMGPRAVIYLLQKESYRFPSAKHSLRAAHALLPFSIAAQVDLVKLHEQCDRVFSAYRCRESAPDLPRIYIGLAILAQRC